MSKKTIIIDTLEDLVADFLVHDRSTDAELSLGAIELAIECNDISINDIVDHFELFLEEKLCS